MAVEKYDCSECGGHGKISFKEESRHHQIIYCPHCGADLDNDAGSLDLDIDEDD